MTMMKRIKKSLSKMLRRRKDDYDKTNHQSFEQTIASCYADEMWDSRSFMAF